MRKRIHACNASGSSRRVAPPPLACALEASIPLSPQAPIEGARARKSSEGESEIEREKERERERERETERVVCVCLNEIALVLLELYCQCFRSVYP
jgi:hypothetical protein